MTSQTKAGRLSTWLFPNNENQSANADFVPVLTHCPENTTFLDSMHVEDSSVHEASEIDDSETDSHEVGSMHVEVSSVHEASEIDDSEMVCPSETDIFEVGSLFSETRGAEEQGLANAKALGPNASATEATRSNHGPCRTDTSSVNSPISQPKNPKSIPPAPEPPIRVLDVISPPIFLDGNMESADFYRKSAIEEFGITGSETDPSMPDSSRESRVTESSLESSRLGKYDRWDTDLDGPCESQIDTGVDRLAICFDRQTIQLLGQSELLIMQGLGDWAGGDQDHSIDFLDDADRYETTHSFQSFQEDVSTLTNLDLATDKSKTPSWDETTTDDWLSDITEQDPVLSESHPFLRCREELLVCGLRGFRDYIVRCQPGSSDQPCQDHPANDQSGSGTSQGTKRSRPAEWENSLNSGSSPLLDRHPPKKPKGDETGLGRTLACLFYKILHIGCLGLTLRRVKDVKQHLWRKHRQPQLYCATCYEVFTSRGDHDAHVRARACLPRERPVWEGISEEVKNTLSRRVETGISEEEQWFSVWDLVFPGLERPGTAYLGNELEELIEMLRDYWGSSGQDIISTVLAQRGLLNWGMPNEERDLSILLPQILRELINTILEQFLTASARTIRRPRPPAVATAGSRTAGLPPLPTPTLSDAVAQEAQRLLEYGADIPLYDFSDVLGPSTNDRGSGEGGAGNPFMGHGQNGE